MLRLKWSHLIQDQALGTIRDLSIYLFILLKLYSRHILRVLWWSERERKLPQQIESINDQEIQDFWRTKENHNIREAKKITIQITKYRSKKELQ